MELTLYVLLTWVSVFFTYLAYSKNIDQTDMNKLLAGILWLVTAANSLVIRYYIPNGSESSYTAITDNSNYWQIFLAVVYMFLGLSIFYQMIVDKHLTKIEEDYSG